jgi:hypothetical protein
MAGFAHTGSRLELNVGGKAHGSICGRCRLKRYRRQGGVLATAVCRLAQQQILRNKGRFSEGEAEFGSATAQVSNLAFAETFIFLLSGGMKIRRLVL